MTVTPKALAQQMGVTQATVTSVVDKLVARGFVRRAPSETDRRQTNVILTITGRSALEEAPDALQQRYVREFVQLADWEQAHAGGMTNQINRPWSPSRVGIGADHALWLPQHDVDQSFTADGFSIDQDAILGGVHKHGKSSDRDAVDFDRPFFNEGLTRTA